MSLYLGWRDITPVTTGMRRQSLTVLSDELISWSMFSWGVIHLWIEFTVGNAHFSYSLEVCWLSFHLHIDTSDIWRQVSCLPSKTCPTGLDLTDFSPIPFPYLPYCCFQILCHPDCFSVFTSVQLLSCVRLFVTPWTAASQASLSITNSRSSPKLLSIESVMPFQCSFLKMWSSGWNKRLNAVWLMKRSGVLFHFCIS